MLKTKIFDFLAKQYEGHENHDELFYKEKNDHNKEISDFMQYLSEENHTFISMNSVSYGRFVVSNRVRTIIVYNENYTRKIITEKNKK